MVSHHLLPRIIQPTEVIEHSATIIDNILTNATEYDIISGNILNQLADNFSQFLIIKKIPVSTKMQPTANMTTQNLIKLSLCQTFLRSSGMRTKIFLLMLTRNFPYFMTK